MNTHFQQPNPQSTAATLARIVTATTVLFRRKEPAIRGHLYLSLRLILADLSARSGLAPHWIKQ